MVQYYHKHTQGWHNADVQHQLAKGRHRDDEQMEVEE